MARAGASLAALAVLTLSTRVATADTVAPAASTTARLEVHAPLDCTTKEALAARVTARAPRVRFAEDDAVWSIRAWFAAMGEARAVAEVVIAGPDGKTASRHLVAQTCDEAADGVALIVAVTLDPSAAAAGAEPPAEPSASGAPAIGAAPAPSAPPPPPATNPVPLPVQEPRNGPRTAPATEARRRPSRWQFGADVSAQGFVGPAPWVLPGVALYLAAVLDRGTVWAPAIVLGATHAWIAGLQRPGGTAAFFLDAASIDACALRVEGGPLEARACASGLAGEWTSRGSDTLHPQTRQRPFAVAGATAIVTLRLGSVVVIAARIASGATLVRDSYEFGDRSFYRAAPVTGSGSLGLGVRWP